MKISPIVPILSLIAVSFVPSLQAVGEPPKVDRAALQKVHFSPEIVKLAMAQKLSFGSDGKMQNGPQKQAYGIYLDALSTYMNPSSPAAAQLLPQIRGLLTGGHEPNAGCGLNGWTHSVIAQTFLLVKKTPEIWAKLTPEEKDRMDWIMRAMAVAGHWGYDDGNDFKTSLHTDDNGYKLWNPNHRLYLFCVLCAAEYFGPKELNDMFVSFNFDEYMKKFDQYKFTNIKSVWTCYDWKTIFEKGGNYISPSKKVEMGKGTGVRHPFTYQGIPLENVADIYCVAAEYNYSKTVNNGIEGKSWILNKGSSPFLGEPGMMLEFESKDAGGVRSSVDYCNENFCSYTVMLVTLKVLGLWPDTERAKNMEKLMYVGNEDFLYKNSMGFHSFSKGHGDDSKKLETMNWLAYPIVLEIWNSYLKPNIKSRVAVPGPK